MDKNTIIGIVIVGAILIGFSVYNGKQAKEFAEANRRQDSIAAVEAAKHAPIVAPVDAPTASEIQAKSDSALVSSMGASLGTMGNALKGEESLIDLENDLIKVTISNKGGRIYSVELKDYKTFNGQPLVLFNGKNQVFSMNLFLKEAVETGKFYFTPDTDAKLITLAEGDSVKSITMRLPVADSSFVDYKYTLRKGSYMVDFQVNMVNMAGIISKQATSIDLKWEADAKQFEKGASNENNYTSVAYMHSSMEFEELSARSDEKSETVPTQVKWVAFKQQFFSSIILAEKPFSNIVVGFTKDQNPADSVLKRMHANLTIPYSAQDKGPINLQFYFGPNHFNTLSSYGHDFNKLVSIGSWIVRWINRYVVIPVFNFLGSYIASYGLIILLLTLLLKGVLMPLTWKSYLSSAKMRVLKPEVDKIGLKYPKKEDAMKKQQEVMSLYKRAGASPLGGCLPMLLQFPILIAMFQFFPSSIELRQESFLWATDLSSYDSILQLPFTIPMYGDHISLFTLLMAVALFFTSRISYAQMGDTSTQMPGMKFMMLYMMPIMMIVWFNNYSAGLSYYYFLSNMVTLGQTLIIRRFVDEEALLAKLRENVKKAPAKKSKFQQRLEDMARRQQDMKKGK
ncbi:membrane protein insertase YidC [Williamwhitmania taraxaci]|uniref:Membrane protein insertase YidC n=1 Tax=Williamwhitmania taraxaci TaxID=1640674 RepID=A0A1G6NFZ1_9BACT|nr:membrane protein insertase YidC [Williamwhitmania taraxaci]SDC66780.1 YidC/Oxa1 family membrane protein insertase [Williamwhitmania taraxaci]